MKTNKKKNLLIVGAGGHGCVVKEIAEATERFQNIGFVDDNSEIAVGTLLDLERLREEYSCAVISIGRNEIRAEILAKLKSFGYELPILIHPSAYVSSSSRVGNSTIVCPMAILNSNSVIGEGCIVSPGVIVDHDVRIGDYVHVNSGAVVMAGSKVESFSKVEAGVVFKNKL